MGLLDLFRARWKHSDPDVRTEAVRTLEDQQVDILQSVVFTDPEARIRRIALRKINDLAILKEVAQKDADTEIRKLAADKVSNQVVPAVLNAADEEQSLQALQKVWQPQDFIEVICRTSSVQVKQAALQQLAFEKDLANVVRRAPQMEIRRQALDRISDSAVLKDLVKSVSDRELALAVLEKVQDVSVLEELSHMGNKTIRQAVQLKRLALQGVASIQPVSLSTEKKRLKQQKWCRAVEGVATSNDWDQATLKILEAQAAWKTLPFDTNDSEDVSYQQRFERALHQFQMRKKATLERLRQEATFEQQQQARLTLCEQIETLPDMGDPQTVHEAKLAWQALGVIPLPLKALEGRFRKACQAALKPKTPSPVAPTESSKRSSQEEMTRPPKPLQEAYQELVSRLEEICGQLENDLDACSRKQLDQKLNQWEDVFPNIEALPPHKQGPLRGRFRQIKERIQIRLKELREALDWKQWAQQSSLEKLCVQAESLVQEGDPKAFLQGFKDIQETWNALRADLRGEKWETLREKFLGVYGPLRERARESAKSLDQERQLNLEKKQALLQEAEQLAVSTDMAATSLQLQQLQQTWKSVGPVPKEHTEVMGRRFREILQGFFARRKEQLKRLKTQHNERIQKKEALCKQAEAMAESTEWKNTSALLRKLQRQWREVGPIPKAQSAILWERFRKACDHFFARRSAAEQKDRHEEHALVQRKEQLCAELERLVEHEDFENRSAYEQMKHIRNQWKEAGPLSKAEGQTLEERFAELCNRFVRYYTDHFSNQQLAELQRELSRFENRILIPTPVEVVATDAPHSKNV